MTAEQWQFVLVLTPLILCGLMCIGMLFGAMRGSKSGAAQKDTKAKEPIVKR